MAVEAPDHGDALAASRTTLELMANLMEASFEALGEGAILASMPAYMERFGRDNAKWLQEHHGIRPPKGAGSSLAAMNFISDVTATPFEMVEATTGHATKRLATCEFLDSFHDRGDFPKTMMCLLHRAAYQGSVNGLVPPEEGFDVQIRSRILFGDPHCDFDVVARSGKDATEDLPALPMATMDQDQQDWLAYAFYTTLLTAFVDYITRQLPAEQVEQMMQDAARKVGVTVHALMDAAGMLPDDPTKAAAAVLRLGGRSFESGATVRACPQAEHIIETTKAGDPASQQAARANACRLCQHFVAGAVAGVDPGAKVVRDGSIALGDATCGYRVERS